MLKILIEGEYPSITDAYSDFDTTSCFGHRLTLEHDGAQISAVVLGKSDAPPSRRYVLREEDIAASYPVLDSLALPLARSVAEYYFAEVAEVLALMLPPALRRKVKLTESPPAPPPPAPDILSQRQAQVLADIISTPAEAYPEQLIWGVTGSGKTRIYEHLVHAAIARGEQAMILVPEIALSDQILDSMEARFPGRTVLYHSGLADGERFKNHRAFLSGKASVLIGTRSAVFLPAKKLGLIVIDEEHDASFKDQRSIRFDTRTVARLRIGTQRDSGIRLVLGSATPSIESLARARTGEAKLHRLRERATGQPLPSVSVPEYKLNYGLIGPFLAAKMQEHLQAGNQVLLLMNRRGHSTHVHCDACEQHSANSYAECARCTVALTYHKDGVLRCHQCGYSEKYSPRCPKDGAERRLTGRGIQRVEEILDSQFSAYSFARLDRDTAKQKDFSKSVLNAMRAREINILIGTQMIAKGFDLEGVTLVGVLAIDQMLTSPDFRASEQAWQLLAQVVGRSGRHRPGEVVIQTMAPHHPAVSAAQLHDADSFYASEAEHRRLTKYPPFGVLARIVLTGENEAVLFSTAERLAAEIQPQNLGDMFSGVKTGTVELLGPAVPSLSKKENSFRVHFLIKTENSVDLRTYLSRAKPLIDRLTRRATGITAFVDIDPREMG